MARLLTEPEITRQVGELESWTRLGVALRREVSCSTFPHAIALVTDVADEAKQMNHHPDIDIRWRTVTFTCTTHSAGGITQLDIELAHRINQLVADLGE